ncbi:MAG TPA: hypothetical protein PKJ26_00770 [Candidatus Woesebacteria bacterium]|nr:hypothetical protein [Candidatus Woesebacteria bacterium]
MPTNGVEPPALSVNEQSEVLQTESTQATRIKKAFEKFPFIEGTFDASEEIGSLKKLSGTERKQKLWQIKTKLARQREAWAQCRITIEQEIEIDPQIRKDDLYSVLHTFAIPYGFTEPQIRIGEAFIDAFDAKRNQINDLRDQVPNDTELVKRLTGVTDPIQIVSVAVSPYAFVIRTDDATYGKIWEQQSTIIYPNYPRFAFAGETRDSESTPFVVINQDSMNTYQDDAFEGFVSHELEHEKEKIVQRILFKSDMDDYARISTELFYLFTNAEDRLEQERYLREYLRCHMDHALLAVRSEFFAIKSEKSLTGSSFNVFFLQDGGPYDYLFFLREWADKPENHQWQAICKKILVDEYTTIIKKAIDAFWSLQKVGYSAQEVIRVLVDAPVRRWPADARRIIEAKLYDYDDDAFLKAEVARFFEPTRQAFCRESSYLQ